jgi:molecular chaperone Hsp33
VAQSRASAVRGEKNVSAEPQEAGEVRVECRFVRERNALLCAGDFGPMFMDCYLHLGQNSVVLAGGADEQLKLLVATLTLHAAAQPRAVTCAWTLHLESERLNVFAVAENPTGNVTGQVFADHVREMGSSVLHSETASADGLRRRSSVDLPRPGLLAAAEAYYEQSEQRAARYFDMGGDQFALLAAQPDCDEEWLKNAHIDEIRRLAEDSSSAPLETRVYRFCCGCTPERIAKAIWPALSGDLEGVFGDDEHIRVSCPRCGSKHEIARELFAAFGTE